MIKKYINTHTAKLGAFLLIIPVLLWFHSCEKDDICVEGDTPLLVIRFYDAENPTEFKSVNSLRVVGEGQENPVATFTDRSTIDSIAIPLRINQPDTQFMLISDSEDEDDVEIGNTDILVFTYTTEEVFVSRACGFVANYNELSETLTADSENWIQNIEVVTSTINSQFSAHVQIFH